MTDDWPDEVPITEAEIEVFEAWFGELFDELFSTSPLTPLVFQITMTTPVRAAPATGAKSRRLGRQARQRSLYPGPAPPGQGLHCASRGWEIEQGDAQGVEPGARSRAPVRLLATAWRLFPAQHELATRQPPGRRRST